MYQFSLHLTHTLPSIQNNDIVCSYRIINENNFWPYTYIHYKDMQRKWYLQKL